MKSLLFAVVMCASLVGWAGTRIYKGIDAERHVTGYLRRAANASTVELAKQDLDVAIAAIEQRGWTQGYTNILWTTPADDVGRWHRNLKAASVELGQVTSSTTELEKSNMLIKLKEVIMDHASETGDVVTVPSGIHIFPHNVGYCVWGILSLLAAAWGMLAFVADRHSSGRLHFK